MTKSKKYRLRFLFQEIDLLQGEFLIGRSPSCNLTLEDSLVSRVHACLKVSANYVSINDLGSRNGTLINGEPIFDNHILENNDRIYLGSHELIFGEESRYPSRSLQSTGTLTICTVCKTTFSSSNSRCPHCNTAAIPEVPCPRCRLIVSSNNKFCARCGTRIDKGDPTAPMETGDHNTGWTSNLLSKTIKRAISSKKFNHATTLLNERIELYESKTAQGTIDISLLLDISNHNATLAKELHQAERLNWIIDKWEKANTLIPADILESIWAASKNWHNMHPRLTDYLKSLKETKNNLKDVVTLIDKLEKLLHGNGSR